MTERSISVRLKANVDDFTREIGKATTKLDDLVKKSGDSSGAATTSLGRLAQSARLQSDSWNTAGASMLAGGAAITAINVAVAKTGIEYNTLQQKSRAALSTLLGGTIAANTQMDKLDAFAKTSPFSKAVFIDAQQQMIGFGIETKKVIPYLSAINEAIAATGGNNNDLSEIVRIFSQIQAAGKITATDLMQFGQRGIDAATMIGSQMGKTGSQIREEITSGSLDAGDALDALAAGMQDRFAGASAGVKNTMEGAFDRVKAAWRDLSSSLMEPMVGVEGGGFLVDATNSAADLIRWLDKFPPPLKNAAAAMSGLAGAGLLAGGAFVMMVPQIAATVTAVKTLVTTFPLLAAAGATAGVSLLLVGGLVATIATDMAAYSAKIDGYADALRVAGEEGEKAERGLAATNLAAAGVAEAMERAGIQTGLATDAALGSANARQSIIDAYDREIQKLREKADAEALQGVYNSQASADADRMVADRDSVVTAIDKEIEARGKSVEQLSQETALMGASSDATATLAGETKNATKALSGLTTEQDASTAAAQEQADAIASARDSVNEYFNAVLGASDANLALEASFDAATEAAEKNGTTLDANTEAGRANQGALNDIVKAAYANADAMSAAGASTADVTAATQRARDQFIVAAKQMGINEDAANSMADELGLIPSDVSTRFAQPGMTQSQSDAKTMQSLLKGLPASVQTQIRILLDDTGYWDANRVLNSIAGKTVTTYVAIKKTGNGMLATGGRAIDAIGLAAGGTTRRQPAGRVYGPGTPTSDSVVDVALSRDEFVVKAAASQHYGYDAMYALNSMQIPKDYFKPLGLAGGGSPSHAYYSPARLAGGGMAGATTGAPALSDNDVARIADAVRFGASAGTREGITERDSMQAHAIGRRR